MEGASSPRNGATPGRDRLPVIPANARAATSWRSHSTGQARLASAKQPRALTRLGVWPAWRALSRNGSRPAWPGGRSKIARGTRCAQLGGNALDPWRRGASFPRGCLAARE
eukprot:724720-Pyramimonas_sp.AAC.1